MAAIVFGLNVLIPGIRLQAIGERSLSIMAADINTITGFHLIILSYCIFIKIALTFVATDANEATILSSTKMICIADTKCTKDYIVLSVDIMQKSFASGSTYECIDDNHPHADLKLPCCE